MLENRIARLERQNRWLKVMGVACLTLAAGPWLLGSRAAVQDVVRTRSFFVVDKEDKPRGGFSIEDDGTAAFSLFGGSSEAAPRIMFYANGETATARFNAPDKAQVLIECDKTDGADLMISQSGNVVWRRPG
jgi:hypothetical protein